MRIIIALLLLLCGRAGTAQPPGIFNEKDQPPAPDYRQQQNWIALPFRKDGADVIPKNETWVDDSLKKVDVFYIYPTLYLMGKTWCADVNDLKLNKHITDMPVKYQAATFNRVARIYAPLYRQGILKSLFRYHW